jgi:RNA polymerase sigma factor (sigma-70 family)
MAHAQLGAVLGYVRDIAAAGGTSCQSDGALLRAFATTNDQAAFTQLVKRHGALVMTVCRRALDNLPDAEDAFQATFLLLARKADSLRPVQSLAGWLHGVAYRTAGHARRAAQRRRQHERKARVIQTASPEWEVMWREVQAVLDEEVQLLPVIYRDAFVLCCLENQSAQEAACALGVKEGTVRSRLSKARTLLQAALARRGVSLSSVLTAAALTAGTAVARAPAPLVASTVRAAVSCAAGVDVDSVVSAQVAALTRGVTQTMFQTKLTKAILLALALGFGIAGAGLLAREKATRESSEPPPAVAAKSPTPADKPAREKPALGVDAKVVVSGRVLDPDGKPAAGAKVSVCFLDQRGWLPIAADGEAKKSLHTVADGEGRFAIPVPRGERDMGVQVVAAADGKGLDWVDVSAHNADKEVTLRLRGDDVVIEGRILDLERRPVAGAVVAVDQLERPADGGDLKTWIAGRGGEARGGRKIFDSTPPMKSLWVVSVLSTAESATPVARATGIAAPATTDKAGRFRLTGFGRETVVHLTVRGGGIETKSIHVCTRDDKVALISEAEIYPARFELLLGPGKVVTGTVTEKGTGKPVAGAAVSVDAVYGHTDDKGYYRLTGISKRDAHYAAARGPHHFILMRQRVPDPPGAEPITLDFELQPAREIRGRLIDKDGHPVRGFVWYSARPDNPNLKDLNAQAPAIGVGAGMATMADGAFRLLACPGPGYLVAKAEQDRFTCAEFKEDKSDDPAINLSIPGWKGDLVPAVPANLVPSHCHAIVGVDPSPDDAKSWTRDIVLDRGNTVKGRLVGPDGKPMAGALAFGLTAIMTTQPWMNDQPERINRLQGADFTALGVNVRQPRPVAFLLPEKNLGKLILVRGDEREPLEVRLEPLGTVTGRLLDSKGNPAAGIVLTPAINTNLNQRNRLKELKDLPGDLIYFAGSTSFLGQPRPYPAVVTADAQGRFTVTGLLPGIKYVLHWLPEAPNGGFYLIQLATVSLEAGKTTKDLGDLHLPTLP